MAGDRTPTEPDLPRSLAPVAGEAPGDGAELDAVEVRDADWADRRIVGLQLDAVAIAGGDLTGTTFVDPAWRDVLLDDVNLANATFRGGLVWRAHVDGGRLTGVGVMEGEWRDVTVRNATAEIAAFRHAVLTRVTFDGCILRQADFMGARCEDVRFHGCDLTGANFADAEMDGAEFRRCTMDEIEGVGGLRGAAVDLEQMMALAPAMAAALGIRVLPPV
jgi:uncharacterized protein YjbI with pentapeptide repeats